MQKFRGVLDRWERRELSQLEAAELLGCSERQFRRYRDRFADEGEAGLGDKRLGKASARRVAVSEIEWMLDQYRTHYVGWNVTHFHEHLQNFVNVHVGRRTNVWRDRRLTGAEVFSDEIEQQLRSSAVLVSVNCGVAFPHRRAEFIDFLFGGRRSRPDRFEAGVRR